MLYSLWPEELQLSYLLQPPDLQADVLQVTLHASARGCKARQLCVCTEVALDVLCEHGSCFVQAVHQCLLVQKPVLQKRVHALHTGIP